MVMQKLLQFAAIASPSFVMGANSRGNYFHESFNPTSHRWYNSRQTSQFDFDAGLNPSDFIGEYGLYAKYAGDYAISTVLDRPVGPFPMSQNGIRIGF